MIKLIKIKKTQFITKDPIFGVKVGALAEYCWKGFDSSEVRTIYSSKMDFYPVRRGTNVGWITKKVFKEEVGLD